MALDQSKVGKHMAEQMEAIEADFADQEGDFEVGDICTIVEIRGEQGSAIRVRHSVTSAHGMLGLIKFAEIQATNMMFGGGESA
jgi:hypothetical protein